MVNAWEYGKFLVKKKKMYLRPLNISKTAGISAAMHCGPHYLQAGALVRKGRTEEACDNAHDCLCYITLQRGVCMLPVTGVVAHLGTDREDIRMMRSRSITLPACGPQVRSPCSVKRDGILCRAAARHHVHVWWDLPYKCPQGSSQTASTCGWRYKSPSSPPLCPRSSGSGSWCRQS